jgi:hypothetical protein
MQRNTAGGLGPSPRERRVGVTVNERVIIRPVQRGQMWK